MIEPRAEMFGVFLYEFTTCNSCLQKFRALTRRAILLYKSFVA